MGPIDDVTRVTRGRAAAACHSNGANQAVQARVGGVIVTRAVSVEGTVGLGAGGCVGDDGAWCEKECQLSCGRFWNALLIVAGGRCQAQTCSTHHRGMLDIGAKGFGSQNRRDQTIDSSRAFYVGSMESACLEFVDTAILR